MLPIYIGENVEQWNHGPVHIDGELHTFIVAKSGSGKSTLLRKMIKTYMDAGFAVIVIDPHGALIDACLNDVPVPRTDDVIVFDPTDPEVSIGLNFFAGSDRQKVAERVTRVLSEVWADAWGPLSQYVAKNFIRAILQYEDRPTFLHVYKILNDERYRERVFESVTDAKLKLFYDKYQNEWDKKKREDATSPVLNKVDTLIDNIHIRNVLGQYDGLHIARDVMDAGRILFCRFSAGRLADDPVAILSAMMTAQVHDGAMERDSRPGETWRRVGFVVDEFHKMTRGSAHSKASLFSELRKYKVGCVASDQDLTHLPDGTEQAILNNVETAMASAMGGLDATRMARELVLESPSTLQTLTKYHWYVKRGSNKGFEIEARQETGDDSIPRQSPQIVIRQSRRHWGMKRARIEALNDEVLSAKL